MAERIPVRDSSATVLFLGVAVPKGAGGERVPTPERFNNNIWTDFDYHAMQEVAIALALNQPVLIEGGSGIGKTSLIDYMGARLNTEVYYANCHDFTAEALIGEKGSVPLDVSPTGFGWNNGIVMRAIRNGGILVLDEYNFMRGTVRGRMHEILDAILQGKDQVVLTENNAEVVRVNPNFRIVCLQNSPGGKNDDREILDERQMTRFVYLKKPSDMPKELMLARAAGFIGKATDSALRETDYLDDGSKLTRAQLSEIEGIDQIVAGIVDFMYGVRDLINKGDLAGDQPQPVYIAYQREFNRIMSFVMNFYNGDIDQTVQRTLRYYFANKFETQDERNKVEALIPQVTAKVARERKRTPVETPVEERRVINRVESERVLVRTEGMAWRGVLGVEVKIPPLPDVVTANVMERLEEAGFELRYMPQLDLGTFDDLKNGGVSAFINALAKRYPSWRTKELSGSTAPHQAIKQLYWQYVAQGNTPFPNLRGHWVAVEKPKKPTVTQKMSESGELTFNLTWNGIHDQLEATSPSLLAELGLPSGLTVCIPDALRYNLYINRDDWEGGYTGQWTNTSWKPVGTEVTRSEQYMIVGGRGVWDFSLSDPNLQPGEVGYTRMIVLE